MPRDVFVTLNRDRAEYAEVRVTIDDDQDLDDAETIVRDAIDEIDEDKLRWREGDAEGTEVIDSMEHKDAAAEALNAPTLDEARFEVIK